MFVLPFLLFGMMAKATEVGTVLDFPAKLTEDWAPSEAAATTIAPTLGPNAWLRFDLLWHEVHWNPKGTADYARLDKLVGICQTNGLRPMMQVTPLPWPGSSWLEGNLPWGVLRDQDIPAIAVRYAEDITAFRDILRRRGMPEENAAVQFGNEPASGHPGGDSRLPPGTWRGANLWAAMGANTNYGRLRVIGPALSMQDHPPEMAEVERASAVVNAREWSAPVKNLALHHRVYAPALSGAAYGDEYIRQLTARVALVRSLDWGAAKNRAVAVTEGYVAPGDAGGDRASALAAVGARLKEGVPNLDIYLFYKWFPKGNFDGIAWGLTEADRAALKAVFNP
ncbi:MAG: hypothetical protein C4320_09850 [Armatimonadota bacterium]